MNYHNPRRSPSSGFRAPAPPHYRAFDSPPNWSPGRGGGFRPIGGGGEGFRPMGGGEYGGFNAHHHHQQQQPPLSGQKRGFPFSGREGSPDRFDGGSFAKLFVGSVPRTATEENIRPLFEEHGSFERLLGEKISSSSSQFVFTTSSGLLVLVPPHPVIPEGGKTCKHVSCSFYSRWDLGGPKDPALAIVAAAVAALPNVWL